MPAIGVFLAFKQKMTELDGEGIGRFTARIVEGMLTANRKSPVRAIIDKINAQNVLRMLQSIKSRHQDRLQIDVCDPFSRTKGITWVNQHVLVDLWLVPYVGLDLALQLDQPFILCLHDLVHMHFRDLYVPLFPDYFRKFDNTVQAMTHKAAAVVFSSNFIKTHEGKFLHLPDCKTRVIRLAPPAEEYRLAQVLDEVTFRNKYNLAKPYIVYPSAIRLHKNHPRLIEAFLKYKQSMEGIQSDVSLVLTDNYMSSPLKSEISSLLRSYRNRDPVDSVIFLGRIPSSDLPSLYKYAVGTIVPTLFEGSFPFQILESFLMDTPVAFSRIELTKELLPDTTSFVTFDPYRIDEIQSAIAHLCHPQSDWASAQKTAMVHILQRTWVDVAQEYDSLAEAIIAGDYPAQPASGQLN